MERTNWRIIKDQVKHFLSLKGFSAYEEDHGEFYNFQGENDLGETIYILVSEVITNKELSSIDLKVQEEGVTIPIAIGTLAEGFGSYMDIIKISIPVFEALLDYLTKPEWVFISFKNLSLDILDLRILTFLDQYDQISGLVINGNRLFEIDLTPLKLCPNLKILDLKDNKLEYLDLSPLKTNLKLSRLDLKENKLKILNLKPLNSCRELVELDLSNNSLRTLNLAPLQNCSKLFALIFYDNKISKVDLSPLQDCLSLEILDFGDNLISSVDLAPLTHCNNLNHLGLGYNEISSIDLTPLASCHRLAAFNLSRNQLTSIRLAPLAECPKFRFLSLTENQLSVLDLSPLTELTQLRLIEVDEDVDLILSETLSEEQISLLPKAFHQPSIFNRLFSKDIVPQNTSRLAPKSLVLGPFYCQLCGERHIAGTQRMQCEQCGRFVCYKSFMSMSLVGRENCPMCEGTLLKNSY